VRWKAHAVENVHAPHPVTGKPMYLRETGRGTGNAPATRRGGPSIASLPKRRKDSTRETYLGYIERTIKPAFGSMSMTKLSVRHLETRMPSCGAAAFGVTSNPLSSTRQKVSTTA
jgi:integrase-like protein